MVLTVGMALGAAAAVQAHHSYASFHDPKERTVTVEGTLERLVYGNPHVVMTIRAADSTVYTITWQSSLWVQKQAGVTAETFTVGDHLVIVGAPSRDAASHEITRVREVRRRRDGWSWRDRSEFAPPS
jgi:hypothetical protein